MFKMTMNINTMRILIGKSKNTNNIAFGGIRLIKTSTTGEQQENFNLAKKLALTMHKKIKCLGLPYSGVKIIGEYKNEKQKIFLLDNIAKHINQQKGSIVVGIDMGFSKKDIDYITKRSAYIIDTKKFAGKRTAEGVYLSIKTFLDKIKASEPKIFIQGYGDVGRNLAKLLKTNIPHCSLGISCLKKSTKKINQEKLGSKIDNKMLFNTEYDIFAPCAIPFVIDTHNIYLLKCKAVIGSSNNPLKNEFKMASILKEKNIFYMPDFLVNSGGMTFLIESATKRKTNFKSRIKSITKKAMEDKQYKNTIDWANNTFNLRNIKSTCTIVKI